MWGSRPAPLTDQASMPAVLEVGPTVTQNLDLLLLVFFLAVAETIVSTHYTYPWRDDHGE